MDLNHCQLYLVQAGDLRGEPILIDLVERQVEIGSRADGAGRVELPGVGPRHATVWRDKSGNWLKPLDGQEILLNSVPVSSRARTKLMKGDSVVLGSTRQGSEFWVLCRRATKPEVNGMASFAKSSRSEFQIPGRKRPNAGVADLSRAEYDVLAWMARGVVEVEEVARLLFRSVNTVRTQLSKVYEKVGVHSRADLLGLLICNSNSVERQRNDMLKSLGPCDCSDGFATGASGKLMQPRSQKAS